MYDLVVRGGTIVDGTGLPGYRADVAVSDGVIVEVGRVRDRGEREIDADGHVVSPGFIDGHTHMDAQVFWDDKGASSSWHGVTTVVMGNCGFTLAPARADARELVVRNLEKAEDIAAEVLAAGITWSWEEFPGFLDAVDGLPKAINYAGYVGHSALRTWAMGERAFEEEATEADMESMRHQLRLALDAGAIGLTTSRSDTHETSDGRPVASRLAPWEEVRDLVGVVGDAPGYRLFALSVDTAASSEDPAVRQNIFDRLSDLSVDKGVGLTFGIISPGDAYRWTGLLDTIDRTNARGGRAFGQALPREATLILSFKTRLPFDKLKEWEHIRSLPLAEQLRMLQDPAERQRLTDAARNGTYTDSIGAEIRPPEWDRIRVVYDTQGVNPTLAEVAAQRGADPVDTFLDLCVESNLEQFFTQEVGNANQDEVLTMIKHPNMIPTFSDSGAHVGYIMESSIQSYMLSYWVRERQELTLEDAVRSMTLAPARAWGFKDRGLVREGLAADLNVFDPATVGPGPLTVENDLPAGASRIKQPSVGFRATIVAGQPIIENGEYTDALPGRLLRR